MLPYVIVACVDDARGADSRGNQLVGVQKAHGSSAGIRMIPGTNPHSSGCWSRGYAGSGAAGVRTPWRDGRSRAEHHTPTRPPTCARAGLLPDLQVGEVARHDQRGLRRRFGKGGDG
jgi:hypothetical protein